MANPPNISFSDSENDFVSIKTWLQEEDELTGMGFYCNIETIESSFHKRKFLAICENKFPIGFAIWHYISDHVASVDILEIHPHHRNRDYARRLVNKLIDSFIDEGLLVVQLQCEPESSESFWRKMNFIDFPEGGSSRWNKLNAQLYRILVSHCEADSNVVSSERIELWNDEPYEVQDVKPNWTWPLEYSDDSESLKRPIIHPCHSDWRIRWIKDDIVVKDNKIKYFSEEEIDVGGFVIITRLF